MLLLSVSRSGPDSCRSWWHNYRWFRHRKAPSVLQADHEDRDVYRRTGHRGMFPISARL